MRRMPTTKQLDYINKLSEGIAVNSRPEWIEKEYKFLDETEIANSVESGIEEESIDLENHTVSSFILFYYMDLDEPDYYASFECDDAFSIPEDITTAEELTAYFYQNGYPQAALDNAYIEAIFFPEAAYYEFQGEYEYTPQKTLLVTFENTQVNILDIYTEKITAAKTGSFNKVNTSEISAVNKLAVKNANLTIDNNKFFLGQLGSNNNRKDAYVEDLYASQSLNSHIVKADVVVAADDGSGEVLLSIGDNDKGILSSAGVLRCSGDSGLELYSEGNITIESDINKIIMVLPTSDPGVEGALWDDNGVLKISHPAP